MLCAGLCKSQDLHCRLCGCTVEWPDQESSALTCIVIIFAVLLSGWVRTVVAADQDICHCLIVAALGGAGKRKTRPLMVLQFGCLLLAFWMVMLLSLKLGTH